MIFLYIVVSLILLVELFEFIYKNSSRYKSTLGGADRFKNVPDGIDICNIGSGPGLYAITYDDCKLKGFNFSTAPQNYKYGFRLLKRFHNNINDHAIIIIIIMCPLSFGANNDYDRKDYSDKFYGILQPKDIDNYSLKRALITSHPLSMHLLKKLKGILIKRKAVVNVEVAKTDAPPVVETWKREFDLKDLEDSSQAIKHQDAFKEKISILQDGLNYCYANNWRPVLVTPPIPQVTRSYIGTEFINEFVYKNVDVLLKNNSALKYINYFDEKLPDFYFANDIFMNREGQEYFSKMLFEKINEEIGEYPTI